MRTIKLVTNGQFNEHEQLRSLISSAPEGGYTIDQVRSGIRVLDKLDVAGAELVLEEPEWLFVKATIATARWRGAVKEIVAFVDKINDAKETS